MQLFINSPATSLIQKDECFRVKGKVKAFDVSPKKIERIVISNTSNLTFLTLFYASALFFFQQLLYCFL